MLSNVAGRVQRRAAKSNPEDDLLPLERREHPHGRWGREHRLGVGSAPAIRKSILGLSCSVVSAAPDHLHDASTPVGTASTLYFSGAQYFVRWTQFDSAFAVIQAPPVEPVSPDSPLAVVVRACGAVLRGFATLY